METITTQGVAIPRLGFGTFRMPGADAQPVVESAIALGYRHIDPAAMYDNEAAVGAAITASGVNRNELFVTTKAWHDQLAADALRRAFDASLGKLRLDHVDLYMIHWPSRDMDMAATLDALMSLRERGLTRAIGVCNFNLPMIRRAVEEIGAPTANVQVEYHPFLSQDRADQSPHAAKRLHESAVWRSHNPPYPWLQYRAVQHRWRRRSRKGRYAPPVRMIELAERPEITPYKWVHLKALEWFK